MGLCHARPLLCSANCFLTATNHLYKNKKLHRFMQLFVFLDSLIEGEYSLCERRKK